MMPRLPLKVIRYVKCYAELSLGKGPKSLEAVLDYCVDRPIIITQVRSEILALGSLLEKFAPKRSLEIGTNYGGTLLMLCTISPPGAEIISLDLPNGRFGGGYPKRKIPLFRKFPKDSQTLHLLRADSHREEAKKQVQQILRGQQLDYLFLDGDHTYEGVKRDFRMYAPLVRSAGMIAFHDIVPHKTQRDCQVHRFWEEIRSQYESREIIENSEQGWAGLGVLFKH